MDKTFNAITEPLEIKTDVYGHSRVYHKGIPIFKVYPSKDAIKIETLLMEAKEMLQFIIEVNSGLNDRGKLGMWDQFVFNRSKELITKICDKDEKQV